MASHYNVSSPLYQALYGVMGVTAIVLTLAAPALGRGIARAPRPNNADRMDALTLAIVIGLVLTFALGGLEGAYLASGPNHFGRLVSSGAELPIFGWSRTTGDFRVAHFIGIHAQQAVPIFGAIAASLFPPKAARSAVVAFAVLYAGLVGATFIEALNGAPVLPL
jgi:hypothetical protein